MEEKRYLKWYNKVGYGSGDVAGNVVYAFLSTFVMLYLTNTVGLNPGIVGTLIACLLYTSMQSKFMSVKCLPDGELPEDEKRNLAVRELLLAATEDKYESINYLLL